jgi:phosphotriesterase-related protein
MRHLRYGEVGDELVSQRRAHPEIDWNRIKLVTKILDEGLIDQLLLSQDVWMQSQLVRNGGCGFAHITKNIEPQLLATGVSQEEISRIRIDNPRRLLAGE